MITRTYKLAIYGNSSKLENIRYTCSKYLMYTQHFLTQLYFNSSTRFLSTKGLGSLGNDAQHKAIGILNAHRAATKETGNKSNCPQLKNASVPAKIKASENSSFDYWVGVENGFVKKRVWVPCKSHRALNKKLKNGWTLNPVSQVFCDKNGRWYVRVFVQKEISKATPRIKTIGCDVGYRNSVVRSDGYIGVNTSKIIKTQQNKRCERQRQGHIAHHKIKTNLKQLLDIEAKRAIARCKLTKSSLVIEDPKVLANLRSGKLHGWASTYFAKRCYTLGEEEKVLVLSVNPAYTSITCSSCGKIDKQSRVKSVFKCTSCNQEFHADINAARNIALKGIPVLKNIKQDNKIGVNLGSSLSNT